MRPFALSGLARLDGGRAMRDNLDMPSTWLATVLDQEQIERTGTIAARTQDVETMPDRAGVDIADELGGGFWFVI